MHPQSLVNSIPFPPRFFVKTLTSFCRHHQHPLLLTLCSNLKIVIVKPLLKKPPLDIKSPKKKKKKKKCCFISKLSFLSKNLDKVVLHKLLSHLQENNLSNPLQLTYRVGHCTETVLLHIVNDILSALDNDNISVLLLLDLSAAFDIIDHQILLSSLYPVLLHSVCYTPVSSVISLRQISVRFSQ